MSLAALVRHLCLRAGLPEDRIDVTGLWGAVEGYAIGALESPRDDGHVGPRPGELHGAAASHALARPRHDDDLVRGRRQRPASIGVPVEDHGLDAVASELLRGQAGEARGTEDHGPTSPMIVEPHELDGLVGAIAASHDEDMVPGLFYLRRSGSR